MRTRSIILNMEIDKELYDYAETGVDIENNFGSQGE